MGSTTPATAGGPVPAAFLGEYELLVQPVPFRKVYDGGSFIRLEDAAVKDPQPQLFIRAGNMTAFEVSSGRVVWFDRDQPVLRVRVASFIYSYTDVADERAGKIIEDEPAG